MSPQYSLLSGKDPEQHPGVVTTNVSLQVGLLWNAEALTMHFVG